MTVHQLTWRTRLLTLLTSSTTTLILKYVVRPTKCCQGIEGPANGTSCELVVGISEIKVCYKGLVSGAILFREHLFQRHFTGPIGNIQQIPVLRKKVEAQALTPFNQKIRSQYRGQEEKRSNIDAAPSSSPRVVVGIVTYIRLFRQQRDSDSSKCIRELEINRVPSEE